MNNSSNVAELEKANALLFGEVQEAMIKSLDSSLEFKVKETLWDGKKCLVEITKGFMLRIQAGFYNQRYAYPIERNIALSSIFALSIYWVQH